jgi:hypothetical protein
VTAVVTLFIVAALLAALSGLIGDEMRGWLELAPRGLLRLVAIQLPASDREAIYDEEWLPELLFILRKAEGRPITRLILGTWYAVSMIRSAGRVGRTLAGARGGESERVVQIQDSDAGRADEYRTIYTVNYDALLDAEAQRLITESGGTVQHGQDGVLIVEGPVEAKLIRMLRAARGREP